MSLRARRIVVTKRKRSASHQHVPAPTNIDAISVDVISAFAHRSARLVLSLCKSKARYARLRDLVTQELGAYAVKHLEELRRMVNS
jgi:hypothetical protein